MAWKIGGPILTRKYKIELHDIYPLDSYFLHGLLRIHVVTQIST